MLLQLQNIFKSSMLVSEEEQEITQLRFKQFSVTDRGVTYGTPSTMLCECGRCTVTVHQTYSEEHLA